MDPRAVKYCEHIWIPISEDNIKNMLEFKFWMMLRTKRIIYRSVTGFLNIDVRGKLKRSSVAYAAYRARRKDPQIFFEKGVEFKINAGLTAYIGRYWLQAAMAEGIVVPERLLLIRPVKGDKVAIGEPYEVWEKRYNEKKHKRKERETAAKDRDNTHYGDPNTIAAKPPGEED
jgi:hypothetical protein